MKARKSVNKYFFITIIILIIVFFCGYKLENYRQRKAMMNTYINTMTGGINFCRNTLYQIDDWSISVDENNVPVQDNLFVQEIRFLKDFNSYTSGYMWRYKNSDVFSCVNESFRTIDILVTSGWNKESSFLSDGVISDNEKLFLTKKH